MGISPDADKGAMWDLDAAFRIVSGNYDAQTALANRITKKKVLQNLEVLLEKES